MTRVLACTFIVLLAVVLFVPQFNKPVSAQDEGMLLVYPQRIAAGDILYRDFDAVYGPFTFWSLAASNHAGGSTVLVERSIGLIYRIIVALAIMAIVSKWTSWGAVAAAAGALLVMAPLGVAASGWFGGLACITASIALLLHFGGRWTIVAGLMAGLAVGFRLDLIVAVILTVGVILLSRRSERTWFAIGFAVAILSYSVAALRSGPDNLVQDLFISPIIESGSGRHLPISYLQPISAIGFWILAVSSALLLVHGLVKVIVDRKSTKNRQLLALSMLTVSLFPQAIQRTDEVHIRDVACVTVPLMIVPIVMVLGTQTTSFATHRKACVAALSLWGLSICALVLPFAIEQLNAPPTIWVTNSNHRVPLSGDYGRNVSSLIPVINKIAHKGDRLFVGTQDLSVTPYTDTELYFLFSDLQPATYFLEFNPGEANHTGTRLSHDVASADVLILNSYWSSHWHEPNTSMVAGDTTANQIVRSEFCRASVIGTFQIFRRCSGLGSEFVRGQ